MFNGSTLVDWRYTSCDTLKDAEPNISVSLVGGAQSFRGPAAAGVCGRMQQKWHHVIPHMMSISLRVLAHTGGCWLLEGLCATCYRCWNVCFNISLKVSVEKHAEFYWQTLVSWPLTSEVFSDLPTLWTRCHADNWAESSTHANCDYMTARCRQRSSGLAISYCNKLSYHEHKLDLSSNY